MASSNSHLFALLLAFFYWEILPMVCGHCILWLQLLGGNSSILWLHNTHHKLLIMWCSISLVCPWRYVKEKLLGIPFHHVPIIVVLHRHHLMCLYILCNVLLDWDSAISVFGWLIPWVSKKSIVMVGVHKILLVGRLKVSKASLFLQRFC